ncbi:HTH CENPB-type domain-containing protein [Nephila pilipes]|uniref:HTH CENPB-type domain-containing protein n=1 Tax=Nephila pilipes TaxID=299642 RepID=A0A8X6MTH3_NEPPI|nr:HTH CENPB-type domain-containing protein [Nephila pilipes]
MSTSTIYSLLKDMIMETNASKGFARIFVKWLRILKDTKTLLIMKINEEQLQKETINESIIYKKAEVIFPGLVKKALGSSIAEVFKGCHGEIKGFKKRISIHGVVGTLKWYGWMRSSGNLVVMFANLWPAKECLLRQVFICDEMGLFWKEDSEVSLYNSIGKGIVRPSANERSSHTAIFCQCRRRLENQTDNAPACPPDLQDDPFEEYKFIKEDPVPVFQVFVTSACGPAYYF